MKLRPSIFFLIGVVVTTFHPAAADAQDIAFSLSENGAISAKTIQLFLLLTVLSLAPGIAIMVTCFPFLVTVLSILRQGIGLQQSPPNMVIVSLAMFLTYFIMEPVFLAAWVGGIQPLVAEEISIETAFINSIQPFREFMISRIDEETFTDLSELRGANSIHGLDGQAPLSILVPSFMLSEITHAFQIGFLIYLPFLIIDLVVAAILMSMGMMMVPPSVVSLPFKLAFFVVADGWSLISGSLIRSYF